MKRQESEHKRRKRIARNHAKPRSRRGVNVGPARINVRQGDFRVIARGERREDPDLELIAKATIEYYLSTSSDQDEVSDAEMSTRS